MIDRWVNSVVAWAWMNYEIRKIDLLRVFFVPWLFGAIAYNLTETAPNWTLSALFLLVLGVLQGVAEIRSRQSPKTNNARIMSRGRMLGTGRWCFIAFVVVLAVACLLGAMFTPDHPLVLSAMSYVGNGLWWLFEGALVPEGPSLRRKATLKKRLAFNPTS